MSAALFSWGGRPIAALATLLWVATVSAQTLTWNPAGPSNVWATTTPHNNWTGGITWPFAGAQTAIFGLTADEDLTIFTPVTVQNLTFNSSQGINPGNSGGSITLPNNGTTKTFTVTNAADTARIDELVTGTGPFLKAGDGTLNLGAFNNYTGTSTISAGTLGVTHYRGASTGAVTVNTGAKLQLNFATNTFSNSIQGAGTVEVLGVGTTTFGVDSATLLTGQLNIATTGSGKAILPSNLGANATVNIAEGATLVIGKDSGIFSFANNIFLQGTGNSESRGALRVEGFTTALSSASTITLLGDATIGNTRASSAALIQSKITGAYILSTAALGQAGLTSGYSIVLGSTESDYKNLTVNGDFAVISVGANTTIVGGAVSKGPLGLGTVSLVNGGLGNYFGTTARTIENTIEVSGGTLPKVLAARTGPLTVNSKITGTGQLGLSGSASQKLTLNGDNSGFAGTFFFAISSTLSTTIGSASAGSAAARWDVNSELRLDFAGDNTVKFGSLEGTSSFGKITTTVPGTKTIEIGELNTSTTYVGSFQNTVADSTLIINKMGIGTLKTTIGTWDNFNGSMNINGGKLLINSTGYAKPITVNNSGTLGGTGTMTSASSITLNTGGTISPGESIGAFTTGMQTWNSGALLDFETRSDGSGTPGTNFDLLNINGQLDLTSITSNNPVVLNLISMNSSTTPGLIATWNPNINHRWDGFVTTSGMLGYDSTDFLVNTSGFQNSINGSFSVVADGSSLDLVYIAAVPEPVVWFTLVCGGLAWGFYRRRVTRNA